MATVNFYLDKVYKEGASEEAKALKKLGKSVKKLLNPKETSIYLILTIRKGLQVKIRTQEKISATNWDFNNKEAKSQYIGSIELNSYLSHLRLTVMQQYRHLITTNPSVNFGEVKRRIVQVVSDRLPSFDEPTIAIAYPEFLIEKESTVKALTMKKYRSFQNILSDFLISIGSSPRSSYCNDFNEERLRLFKAFFENRENANDTISKYIECLKVFLRWATKKNYCTEEAFEDFSIRREKKKVIWLNKEEVERIRNLDLRNSAGLSKVRDYFIFQVFTGQRWSDIVNLKNKDVIYLDDIPHHWLLHQIKGNKPIPLEIPLLPEAVEILERYIDKEQPNKFLFETISNQATNRNLKEICKRAGITQLLTDIKYSGTKRIEKTMPKYAFVGSHCARRSFVCICIQRQMSPDFIMAITGHEEYKTMRKYLAISSQAKREALFKAWS